MNNEDLERKIDELEEKIESKLGWSDLLLTMIGLWIGIYIVTKFFN